MREHSWWSKIDERLRCSAGRLRCVCAVVHTKASLCRDGECVSSTLQYTFVCVCMVENQCMPQPFWQLSSQCFPVPKPNCPSSSSIGPPSVLYRPTHSACLLSRHHFGSQNKPTILLPDLFTHQACQASISTAAALVLDECGLFSSRNSW